MEKSPSWSRAHDWKSCRPLKGLEGSNPSFSANVSRYLTISADFFTFFLTVIFSFEWSGFDHSHLSDYFFCIFAPVSKVLTRGLLCLL